MALVKDGTVNGYRTLKDGSLKLDLQFTSISPEDAGQLTEYVNQHVKIAISNENVLNQVIKELDAIPVEHEEKSPSRRMRAVLYRLWEQEPSGYEDFELFYRHRMEQMISWIKNKLA